MNEEIEKCKRKIAKHSKRIKEIQEDCPHPTEHLFVEHRSDTCNFDPSEDRYWKYYHCSWCDKTWTEDQ